MKKNVMLLRLVPACVLPILCCGIMLWLRQSNILEVFPSRGNFLIIPYFDPDTEGTSRMREVKIYDDKIDFSYTLGTGTEYPFAGLNFSPRYAQTIKLAPYDSIRFSLKFEGFNGAALRLFVRTYIPDITNIADPDTHKYSETEFLVTDKNKVYQIRLKDLKTPLWWYDQQLLPPGHPDKNIYSLLTGLDFVSGTNIPRNRDMKLSLGGISLRPSPWPLLRNWSFFLIPWYICLFYIYRKRKLIFRISSPNFPGAPKRIEIADLTQANEHKIFKFIKEQYMNPAFSLKLLASHTGISGNRVSEIIKKQTGLSFKQYLNWTRLEEAKRLLAETDLRIGEIAFLTGYNNSSHFNRIFKELENRTPGMFRLEAVNSGKTKKM